MWNDHGYPTIACGWLLLAGSDIEMMPKINFYLQQKFEMKDKNEPSYVLAIRITSDCKVQVIYLDLEKYI